MPSSEFQQKVEIVRQKVEARQLLSEEEKLLWLASELVAKSLRQERGYRAP